MVRLGLGGAEKLAGGAGCVAAAGTVHLRNGRSTERAGGSAARLPGMLPVRGDMVSNRDRWHRGMHDPRGPAPQQPEGNRAVRRTSQYDVPSGSGKANPERG